jgi:2-polyprenyl-6-methoxyphenol hydroxylase-like FAD-dependent oxidoreductase
MKAPISLLLVFLRVLFKIELELFGMSKAADTGKATAVTLGSGREVTGDVLIGADGMWSAVRATIWDEPTLGDDQGPATRETQSLLVN